MGLIASHFIGFLTGAVSLFFGQPHPLIKTARYRVVSDRF